MGKSKNRPTWEHKIREEVIMKSREEKDLGVIVQDSLPHKMTHRMLTNIRVAFHNMDKDMMKKL